MTGEDGWQPIETAPEGATILGLRKYPMGSQPVVCGQRYNLMAGCIIDCWRGKWWPCTHWMPLPAPPVRP